MSWKFALPVLFGAAVVGVLLARTAFLENGGTTDAVTAGNGRTVGNGGTSARDAEGGAAPNAVDEERVRASCGSCHRFPPPDALPRHLWETRVSRMYALAAEQGVAMPVPAERVTDWYTARAPEHLPPADGRTNAGWGPVDLSVADWRPPGAPPASDTVAPGTLHVRFARLFDGPGADLIVSDALHHRVYAVKPYALAEPSVVLGRVQAPGRAEVVDLDGDGREDVVVAGLGSFLPTNARVGSVVWFRRTGAESFESRVLLDDVGRVADVRAADLTGNGRQDLVVAVFGWRENGAVLWLENVGVEGSAPEFVRHVLDPRSGAVDVRIADFDEDGHLDIAALLSQEHEEVMLYRGTEDGFRAETAHRAPHPEWGYSGMEAVDFTGDGSLDIVVTNGDALDSDIVKPYHGVGLLENRGDGTFRYHHLTSMYGAFRAVPADLTGDGSPGLLVSAHLLPSMVRALEPEAAEGIVWLQRVGPTRLVRRVLKPETPYHLSMDAADFTGDGRTDFAVAWVDFAGFVTDDPAELTDWEPMEPWVSFWRNDGPSTVPTGPSDVDVIDWSGDN